MVKQFSSFSPCGKTFVSCGADGKLKLWDTLSGILKQEFVPNLHLNQPCTSFVWIRLVKSFALQHKQKKRKSLVGSDALGLGTNNGVVAVYNIKEGKIACSLQGGHTTSVSCMAWSKANELFSASENNVVIWDMSNKSVKSKWKCGKGKITCLGVSDEGDLCITGSFKLKIWNVQSKTLVKELTGHSSDVTNIQFISSSQLFLSTASTDRYITVWSVNEESEEPVGRFVLGDSVQGDVSTLEDDGCVRLASACNSGILHYFSHQFNGSRSKALKHVYRVEVASGGPVENGSSSKSPKSTENAVGSEVSRLPIIAVHLISPTSATIAYGHSPALTFETIEMKETKESSYLVRAPVVSKSSHKSPMVENNAMVEDAEYIGGGIVGGGSKRQRDGKGKEVPLEERLNNLSTQDLTTCVDQDTASPHSMAQLLSQALQSKDRALLETVLFRKDISVVKQTISRLPVSLVPSLVRELSTMVQGKALTSSIAVVWLRCLLSLHSSQLLADEESLHTLSGLYSLVETRLATLPSLFRLSGRLDLLLQQVHGQSAAVETDQPALLIFQDEDSSEEGSSIGGDGPDVPSESEDKWDELSDLDTEEMST